MKIQLLCASLLATFVFANAPAAQAQGVAAPVAQGQAEKPNVAVIDIFSIYKGHIRFKQQMDQLKAQMQSIEESLRREEEEIVNLTKQHRALAPGSTDFKALEDKILQRRASLGLEVTRKRKEIVEQETQVRWSLHQEIEAVVKQYCTYYNIDLVIHHSTDPVDPNDMNSVARRMGQPIIYVGPKVDITREILEQLNRGATAAVQPAAGNAAPRQTGLPRQPIR